MPSLTVGLVLFPGLTQLDLTGPYEVFSRMPETTVRLVARSLEPVRSEKGLSIVPDTSFDRTPPLDVLCVPGGPGVNDMMQDDRLLRFLQHESEHARFVTSVCTGALLLGAAGLLRGYRATTHWLSLDLLELFGADAVDERVVIDRNRITGGGVTAGIDFGLVVAATLFGDAVAQQIQLMIEYNPAPPFQSGSRSTAPPEVVEHILQTRKDIQAERRAIAQRIAGHWSLG
jgi:cyclohexyl-isocyanide hydratase